MRTITICCLMTLIVATLLLESQAAPSNATQISDGNKPSIVTSLLDRARQQVMGDKKATSSVSPGENDDDDDDSLTTVADGDNDDDDDNDGDDEDDDDDDNALDDGDDEDEPRGANKTITLRAKGTDLQMLSNGTSKIVTDIFGNKLKLDNDRTYLIAQNKARDLGLITIKALLLGPIIGLTLKAALMRGLLWAVAAYVIHLFFPSLLSALGLGTGLVGFARQLQPDYASMLLPHLANLPNNLHSALPNTFTQFATQYRTLFQPVVESIRTIPEGHCRFRGVCETANYLIKNTQFMSHSLQRISATVYLNFGTEYSKAWLDGIVQSDCATKYSQCPSSPFSMVANRLAETIKQV